MGCETLIEKQEELYKKFGDGDMKKGKDKDFRFTTNSKALRGHPGRPRGIQAFEQNSSRRNCV